MRSLLAASLLFPFPSIALGGATVIVPVAEDESVLSSSPDKNYSDNMNRGGLFVGSDGTDCISRFYLKFHLPSDLAAKQIASATLLATYLDDFDREDNGVHRIHYVASDDWSEKSITWDNQPGPTFGTPEATFDAAAFVPGKEVKWDLTEVVKRELEMDRTLSLMFAAGNEGTGRANRNWEYFPEHELDPAGAFRLSLVTTLSVGSGGGPVPVPLPPAVWPAAITLAGAVGLMAQRRIKRRSARSDATE